jgi:nitroreductase
MTDLDRATVDRLLTTTRSVRKRLDFERPVEPEVIEECLELALQAPSGSNRQGWHFVIVTDADKKLAIAEVYRKNFEVYDASPRPEYDETDARASQQDKVHSSAAYLAQNMEKAPVLIIACLEGRPKNPSPASQAGFYGSILPAAWSLMLALRSRGLGSAWTTMYLSHEDQVAELLGIPDNVTQAVLLPVAYYTGDSFKPAKRLPLEQVTHWNSWGNHRP